MNKYLFGFLVFLASLSNAYVLHLVVPVNVYLQPLNPTVVSPVGPGYTVVLAFDRDTGQGFVWDRINCVTKTNWNITYGKNYKYLYALLKVPVNASEGNYTFTFTVADRNGDHVQEDAQVMVHVTRNPSDLVDIMPLENETLKAGNNTVYFELNNKALGRANYEIDYWVEGTSNRYKKQVTIEPGKMEKIGLPVYISTEGFYKIDADVRSLDTPIIHKNLENIYYVRPTLRSKLSSIASGFPVVPVPLAPVYALLGLLTSW